MPGGRPSRYDWDDKKDICYKLYVEEKKTPNQIVRYFAEHFNVPESEIPSARLFRRQFSEKWKFPGRLNKLTEEEETAIVERIRQLWEQNLDVKALREVLADEGWDLGVSQLNKLRRRKGFARRVHRGSYIDAGKKRKSDADGSGEDGMDGTGDEAEQASADALLALQQQPTQGLSPEEQARRAQRMQELLIRSDQALIARKRRRRIRGYGNLPADDPGVPPRYDSETTLDECKAFLHLTNDMYLTIRADYEKICLDMGIERKKTVMENGIWQASKDRLIVENLHLAAMMHPLQPNLEKKAVAIDVICADVTKRMRDSKKKLTVAEANNALGLNPAASKDIRRAFYDVLTRDHYTTKVACGNEHWQELLQEWYSTSELLQQVVAEGDPFKLKCLGLLSREANKRYNDDKIRADPNRRQYTQNSYGPGPGSCKSNQRAPSAGGSVTLPVPTQKEARKTKAAAKRAATAPVANLDPALTEPQAPPLAIPAYFRLSLQSQLIGNHPRMWLGKLDARTVPALHRAATSKAGAVRASKVHGIIKNEDGTEDSYQIDGDDELEVYLEAAGEKATFAVVLEGGYA